jgi:hypothetical protein
VQPVGDHRCEIKGARAPLQLLGYPLYIERYTDGDELPAIPELDGDPAS